MKSLLLIFISFLTLNCDAQEDAFVDKYFLIVYSSENYEDALSYAKKVHKATSIELTPNGYIANDDLGFIDTVACDCGEFHDYMPRGRYDDGTFITVEYSSGYENFSEGYYIVITASGEKKEVEVEEKRIRVLFPNAYMKKSSIYMGCMH